VSTGKRGYDTPVGDFKPFRMEKDHFSREWDDAPMPHSIFFTQEGHAIHGSFDVKRLGSPASHGCVRLSPQHAATLFALVKQEKMANTRVVLTGVIPGGAGVPQVRRPPGIDPYGDDGFTAAIAPPANVAPRRAREEAAPRRARQEAAPRRAREAAQPRRVRPAYFDGRYYYDRDGRRIYGAAPAYAGRYYDRRAFTDYERPRPRGLFER
jgi:hypothetical protein